MGANVIKFKGVHDFERKLSNYNQGEKPCLKDQEKTRIRIMDESSAITRFKWFGVPGSLDGQELERMLYYKYSLAMFYHEELEDFFILPYVLDGSLDVYGRYNGITPVPFVNGQTDANGKFKPWIPGLSKKVLKTVPLNITIEDFLNGAVILRDYTNQLGENGICRAALQEGIIDYEAEVIAMHRTALINNTGVEAVRVGGEDEVDNVYRLNNQVQRAALNGDKYLAVVGQLDFQNISSTSANPQQFTTALATIDSLRLSGLGLGEGSLNEKQGTVINAEFATGELKTGSILQDGLMQRQKFCMIANALWGLGIWCEVNQDFDIMQEQNQSMKSEVREGDTIAINEQSEVDANE